MNYDSGLKGEKDMFLTFEINFGFVSKFVLRAIRICIY